MVEHHHLKMYVRHFRQDSKWSIPGTWKAMMGGSTRSILFQQRGQLWCGDAMTNPRRDWSSIKYMPVCSPWQFVPTASQKGSASTLIRMSLVDAASETAAVLKTSGCATAGISIRPLVPPWCSETALAGDHCTVRLLNDVQLRNREFKCSDGIILCTGLKEDLLERLPEKLIVDTF